MKQFDTEQFAKDTKDIADKLAKLKRQPPAKKPPKKESK